MVKSAVIGSPLLVPSNSIKNQRVAFSVSKSLYIALYKYIFMLFNMYYFSRFLSKFKKFSSYIVLPKNLDLLKEKRRPLVAPSDSYFKSRKFGRPILRYFLDSSSKRKNKLSSKVTSKKTVREKKLVSLHSFSKKKEVSAIRYGHSSTHSVSYFYKVFIPFYLSHLVKYYGVSSSRSFNVFSSFYKTLKLSSILRRNFIHTKKFSRFRKPWLFRRNSIILTNRSLEEASFFQNVLSSFNQTYPFFESSFLHISESLRLKLANISSKESALDKVRLDLYKIIYIYYLKKKYRSTNVSYYKFYT